MYFIFLLKKKQINNAGKNFNHFIYLNLRDFPLPLNYYYAASLVIALQAHTSQLLPNTLPISLSFLIKFLIIP